MPFNLSLVRNHGYLTTIASVDPRVAAVQCRSVAAEDPPGAWRWMLDLASPLRNAMALSEFAPRMEISTAPAIAVSFPQHNRRVRYFEGEPFDAAKVTEALESTTWVPLPPVAGASIRQVANQLEPSVGSAGRIRLSLDGKHMTVRAHQDFPPQEEAVAEFELAETKISGLSFSLPRALLTREFCEPLSSFRLACSATHCLAALLLSDDTAIVFGAEVEITESEMAPAAACGSLIPGPREELFALLRPVVALDGGQRSCFDTFDDLLLEAVRYLLTAPGEPCITFATDSDGVEWFEIARFCHEDFEATRWFSLNLSHRHGFRALDKVFERVQGEIGLEMTGVGVDEGTSPYASGSFTSCLSPLACRERIRSALQIVWGAVPQHFTRVEWRNLDERYSNSTRTLQRQAERRQVESVRFDRDRQPVEFIKELYGDHCQVCGYKIATADGTAYSEVHHIRFMNRDGPDMVGNMLVLCPTHHKEFDLSILTLDPQSCRITSTDPTDPRNGKAAHISDEHRLDAPCLEWARHLQQCLLGHSGGEVTETTRGEARTPGRGENGGV